MLQQVCQSHRWCPVELQEGDGAGMGPAALAWLLARAPMHEAPGRVKADLEASGANGLASLTPASVRCPFPEI